VNQLISQPALGIEKEVFLSFRWFSVQRHTVIRLRHILTGTRHVT